ncbi:U3IP2-like protein [Mya arenaria]|uniref:U3IP2-like protein n=1 Tax=Mya arenaria TaxID=6604 RepID=A0ABY7FVR0_MYAAR|nr:U3IP2-like protein [Mya arenaria]
MSFFIKGKGKSKPKSSKPPGGKRKSDLSAYPLKKKKFRGADEEIESDSDVGEDDIQEKIYSSSEEEEETAQEKKLRLAKHYIAQIEAEESGNILAEDVDRDLLQTGKLQKKVADNLETVNADSHILFRGHQLSVTCVVISTDRSVKERRKLKMIHGGRKGTEKKHVGHTGHILAMAISTDGNYLATGDADKLIHLWDAGTMELIYTFKGHRDAVTGLSFRKDTHELYSCSDDRSVKIWNVDERAYVETLTRLQPLTVYLESELLQRVDETVLFGCSVDCIALINESNFISGADDNSLSLWGAMKKKPLFTLRNVHGPKQADENGNQRQSEEENWISAVAALHNTDLVASGSKDGCVRLWKCMNDCRKLEPVMAIPVVGFVNSLHFSTDGQYLVAGVGQEHRLGRWWSNKAAKNSILVIPLKFIVT